MIKIARRSCYRFARKSFRSKARALFFFFSFFNCKKMDLWKSNSAFVVSAQCDAFSRLRWKISRQVFRGGGFLEGEREKKQLSLCHGWLTKTNVRRSYQVKSGIPLLRGRKTGPERWKRKENLATFFFFFHSFAKLHRVWILIVLVSLSVSDRRNTRKVSSFFPPLNYLTRQSLSRGKEI